MTSLSKAILSIFLIVFLSISVFAAWDDVQTPSTRLQYTDWNGLVNFVKNNVNANSTEYWFNVTTAQNRWFYRDGLALSYNESRLNSTITSIAGSVSGPASQWNITGSPYLYNNTGVLYLNESKLNSTSVAAVLAADSYLRNTGDTASGNFTFDINTFFIDSTNNKVAVGSVAKSEMRGLVTIKGDDNETDRGALMFGGATNTDDQAGIAYLVNANNDVDLMLGHYYSYDSRFQPAITISGASNTGYVGIGITTPSYLLDVIGTGQIARFGTSNSDTYFGIAENRAFVGYDFDQGDAILQGGSGKGMHFVVNSTSFADYSKRAISINPNTYVGIGNSDPGYKFVVEDNNPNSDIIAKFISDDSGTTRVAVDNDGSGDPAFAWQLSGATIYSLGVDDDAGDSLVLSASTVLGTNNQFKVHDNFFDLEGNQFQDAIISIFNTYDVSTDQAQALSIPPFYDLLYDGDDRGVWTITANRSVDQGELGNVFELDINTNSGDARFSNVNTNAVSLLINRTSSDNYMNKLVITHAWRDSHMIDYTVEVYADGDDDGIYTWTTKCSVTDNKLYVVACNLDQWRVKSIRINVTEAGTGDRAGYWDIGNIAALSFQGKPTGHLIDSSGGYIWGSLSVSSTLNSATLNTGQGNNELYAMNQNVRTTDSVTFDTVEITTPAAECTEGYYQVSSDGLTRTCVKPAYSVCSATYSGEYIVDPTANSPKGDTYEERVNSLIDSYFFPKFNTSLTMTANGNPLVIFPWYDSSSACQESNLKSYSFVSSPTFDSGVFVSDEQSEGTIAIAYGNNETRMVQAKNTITELASGTYAPLPVWIANFQVSSNKILEISNDTASDATARFIIALYVCSNNDAFSPSVRNSCKEQADALVAASYQYEFRHGTYYTRFGPVNSVPCGGANTCGTGTWNSNSTEYWGGYSGDLHDAFDMAYNSTGNYTYKRVAEDIILVHLHLTGYTGGTTASDWRSGKFNYKYNITSNNTLIAAAGNAYYWDTRPGNVSTDTSDWPRALELNDALRTHNYTNTTFQGAYGLLKDYTEAWIATTYINTSNNCIQYNVTNQPVTGNCGQNFYNRGLTDAARTFYQLDDYQDSIDAQINQYNDATDSFNSVACNGVYQSIRTVKSLARMIGKDAPLHGAEGTTATLTCNANYANNNIQYGVWGSNTTGLTQGLNIKPGNNKYLRQTSSGSVGASLITDDGSTITLSSGASINEFSTDDTLSGNSDSAVPTEQAVKTYVDNEIAGVSVGAGSLIHQQTFSLSSTTAEQSWTVNSTFDRFKICFEVYKSSSSGSGGFEMRINGATSGYKQNYISYSTPANPNEDAFFFGGAEGTGSDNVAGCVDLNRIEINSENIMVTGNVYSADQDVWFGGRVDAGGNAATITFDDYGSDSSFTGTINIWAYND